MEFSKLTKRLLKVIPGGCHTYSRGADTFPSNAPAILDRGKGVYIYDQKNNKYLDYGMGLRSVNIGYSETKINQAAIIAINKGNNLTRPSLIELRAAELFTSLIKQADMVKFTKNGSTAVTAAVKLARAYTKKKIVLRCAQQPFFSFDDWFIGNTNVPRGVTEETKKLTKKFNYNDIKSLEKQIKKYKNKIACVVLEPSSTECPKIKNYDKLCCNLAKCNRDYKNKDHFLKQVEKICRKNKIVFILDEMITGFRWDLKGAQNFYGVNPDLSTFGKAMANGFSVSAICGKKKIMELGSITKKNEERVFLLSTTHGAEMNGLSAFIQTLNFLKREKVIQKNWDYGAKLILEGNKIAKKIGVDKYFYFSGIACSPQFNCLDNKRDNSLEFRTLFMQEMLKEKILMPWISISYRHNKFTLKKTLLALEKTLTIYKKALNQGVKKYLKGHTIKPVFRRFN
ncbi:glutamate-1-semialdehyde 2,1-aminomutase [Candidatus Pelagibacter ubique]|jgi:glutamate-1-semialdehyde 2,1-aminomutase|nr:glutamate-1-semialdehyde 2,1-aminomutase [Candidatus Pelagibacter ubique]